MAIIRNESDKPVAVPGFPMFEPKAEVECSEKDAKYLARHAALILIDNEPTVKAIEEDIVIEEFDDKEAEEAVKKKKRSKKSK